MRRGLSLRWRMVMLVAGIPLLILTPLIFLVRQQQRDSFRDAFWSKANLATVQMEQTVSSIAPFVATLEDAPGLDRLLEITSAYVEDFDFIGLVDGSGHVIASPMPIYAGRTLDQLRQLEVGATMQGDTGGERYAVVRRDLGYGDTYLVWRAMVMPGDPDASLYVVVGEHVDAVEPSLLPLIAIGLVTAVGMVFLIRLSLDRMVLSPLNRLAAGAEAITAGDLRHRISLDRDDEFGLLAGTFNEMTERISALVSGLEQRVEARTMALERRNAQLEAVSLVSQEAARHRNVTALLNATVTAISDNFGFYHTGIFILDDHREWAILRAASSEGGKRMLNRGHRLEVGRVGIVGYVAAHGRPRVAFNVGSDAVWFQNPDLPRTQAEMALPLMTDDNVIGVLDIQSDRASTDTEASFTDEDIRILQLLADQLTVALNNARALETMEAALQELQALQIDYSRRGWARVTQRMRPLAYEYDRVETRPVPPLPVPDDLAEGHVSHKIMMDGGMPVVMEALRVGGRTLGYLGLSDPERTWSAEELALLDSVGEQVALALDNARLFEDTQRNERQQYLISSVLQVASNPDYSAGQVLYEIARILAEGLDMAVAIFTFPYPARTVVRSHAVIAPDGQSLPLFEEDLTLSQEHYVFFQGLESADLGPMVPLLASSGDKTPDQVAGYDFDRVLYVPIRSAGARNGFIGFIQRQDTPPLDPDTRELAESLASQVAVVLENLNLTEETRQRSEELRQLYRVSLELSEQLSPDDVLTIIVEEGARLLGADAANLWIYEPSADGMASSSAGEGGGSDADSGGGETLRLAFDYQGGAEGRLGYASRSGEGLAGAALTQQQTILVDDYATWQGRIPALVSTQYHGMMAVPLVGRFGPLGVFVALSEQTGAFGEREAGLADLFSAQAATALENARLNEDAQRRAEEFSHLYEAGIDLITIREAEDLLERAADWARQIFEAEHAVVLLRDTRSNRFVRGVSVSDRRYLMGADDDDRHKDPDVDGVTETVAPYVTAIRDRETVLVVDNRTAAHAGAARLVDLGLLSQMGAPLTLGDQALGAVFVSGALPGRFDEEDLALLEFLATQVSSALQNAIQFGQTEEALAVVGQQARYQTNVSQAVALLNDRGTEATGEVLHLLGEAAGVPVILYFESVGNNGRTAWRLTESWVEDASSTVDGASSAVDGAPDALDRASGLDGAQAWLTSSSDSAVLPTLYPERLTTWRRMLLEDGQVMMRWEGLPLAERAHFVPFEFGAALGLSVPGQEEFPGFLALFREEGELWGEQEVVALQTVAAALSNTLARENLFRQVQATLSETEALYRGGAALSEANTYESILEVLLAHTALGRDAETATMQLFDRPWTGAQRPEFLELVAYWRTCAASDAVKSGEHAIGLPSEPKTPSEDDVQRRYRLDEAPVLYQVIEAGQPVFVEDLEQDEVLGSHMAEDGTSSELLRWATGARSVVIMPLAVGGQRIGFLQAGYGDVQVFSEADRRRLVSLAQQASIAVLNIRQLHATEARVRREQLIRQITGRIQEAPDVDGVLQTAVREIAQAFGTPRGRIEFQPPQEELRDPAERGSGATHHRPGDRPYEGDDGDGAGEHDELIDWRDLNLDEG